MKSNRDLNEWFLGCLTSYLFLGILGNLLFYPVGLLLNISVEALLGISPLDGFLVQMLMGAVEGTITGIVMWIGPDKELW
jgi:hypothetical protein